MKRKNANLQPDLFEQDEPHQGVLSASALGVIEQLICRRLPDVDVSLAR